MGCKRTWVRLCAVPALLVACMATGSTPRAMSRAAPACGAWTVVAVPTVPGSSELIGLTALTPHNVWAVGDYGLATARTLVEHYDGTGWHVVPSPNIGLYANYLNRVAAIAADNVWAVGDYVQTARGGRRTLVEHYDGATWRVVPSPSPGTGDVLGHITAVPGTNQLWAVGNDADATIHADRTLVEHYDGTMWRVVPSPNVGRYNNDLSGVTAIAANDIWAVGGYDDAGNHYQARLIEHYDGTAWRLVAGPAGRTSSGNYLNGVAAVSATDIWAVGTNFLTLAERYNGVRWHEAAIPSPTNAMGGNNGATLYDVAPITAHSAWAVGAYYESYSGAGGYTRTLVEHWNGVAWRIIASPNPDTTGPATARLDNELFGVAAAPATGQVWAVGRYLYHNTPRTLITSYC